MFRTTIAITIEIQSGHFSIEGSYEPMNASVVLLPEDVPGGYLKESIIYIKIA
jgi:hypothetical protein